jgi:hypothetical protein
MLFNTEVDPETHAGTDLHADLIDANQSASDLWRCAFRSVQWY